jgi:hypothetical protein
VPCSFQNIESGSGVPSAMLASEQGRQCHLGAKVWLTDRHLLVDDWQRGDLWLWDVQSERVSKAAISQTSHVNVHAAREVIAERLRKYLRRQQRCRRPYDLRDGDVRGSSRR